MEGFDIKKENIIENEKSLFEERYEKEILPIIDALCPDDEKPEEFEKRIELDLKEGLKKIQVAQGKLIEHDENKNLEETKAILISRIKNVLEDERRYQYKNDRERPDFELVLRSKIALLLAGDLSDLDQYVKDRRILSVDELKFEDLTNYLSVSFGDKKRKLSEKEIEELVSAGFCKQLATIWISNISKNIENIPESLFLELIKNNDGFWLDDILKNNPSKKKYSHQTSKELVSKGYSYIVLENIEKFDDLNLNFIKSLIVERSADYPFHANDVLKNLSHINLNEEEETEIIDFVLKYNFVTAQDDLKNIKDEEIKQKYEKIESEIKNIIRSNKKWENTPPEQLPKEDLERLKEYIGNGYITFFHKNGANQYCEYFFKNDYEWLRDQTIKNNQENLLLVFHELKDEDQEKYAGKLVEKNEISILKTLIRKEYFSKEILSQRIFEKLMENNYIAPLNLFNNLNEKSFIYLLKNKFTNWEEIEISLKHFFLPESCLSKEIIKEIIERTDNPELRYYYVNNFFDKNKEERSRILNLIDEILPSFQPFSLVTLYVEKFKDSQDKEERKNFIKKHSEYIKEVSKNESIKCSDDKEYRIICEAVYPKRNYNTYQYINEYKNRSKDLDSYTFDKNGYQMRLSGVVGYKIKDGFNKNPELLSNYQNRIKDIENLATSNENLTDFISQYLPETESKTLEGKIIEYIRKNRADSKSVDLLLAYQLHGNYNQFVRESADRTDMYEKMEGKEYVMLSELSERYGDLMKETLKEIGKKVNNSEDKELFIKDISDEIKKGEKLSSKIANELSQIPEDKLTTNTIQKKVAKSIINTFQQIPSIKNIAETFAGSFTKENFSSFQDIFKEKIKEIFQEINNEVDIDIQQLETLRQKTYEDIKSELDKYEEIKEIDENKKGEVKMSKERLIKGYFSKNRENAHARMIGDICIATDSKMLENKNYFEFVLFDESRKKCVGTTMLLTMEEPKNKKYLLYCPNPSVDLVSQVSAEKLYKLITKEITAFAEKNNFDGVLIDKRRGHSTNRSGLFLTSLEKSILRNNKDEEIIFDLKNKHELGGGYVYQENLNAVWLP